MIPIKRDKAKLNYTDPNLPRYVYLDHPPSKHPHKKTFKVLSYNIFHSLRVKQAIELIQNHRDLHNADVICVQEMTMDGVKMLSKEMGYNFVYYPAIKHPKHGKDFGNAVLSKWPVEADSKHILPHKNTKKLQRVAVATTLDVNGKKVLVCSLHMEVILKPNFRAEQVESLIQAITPDMKHLVVAGDFNTFTPAYRRAVVDPFLNAGFDLATESVGWTYKHWYLLNKKTILDHIFTKGMDIIRAGKAVTRVPSDHLPVWAEMTFQ